MAVGGIFADLGSSSLWPLPRPGPAIWLAASRPYWIGSRRFGTSRAVTALRQSGWLWPMRLAGSFVVVNTVGKVPFARGQSNIEAIASSPITSWPPEFYLVLVFCLLGFSVLAMQFVLFLRSSERISANDIMRAVSTTLILISVVALVGVGYSEKQVQPALGVIVSSWAISWVGAPWPVIHERSPQRRKPDDALEANDD